MLPNFNLKDEHNLAVQDKKEMSRMSGEMKLYYAYDDVGLEAVYAMAEALTEIGCTPKVTQGVVMNGLYEKCFELKTGPLSMRQMEVVQDTLDMNELTKEYTAFQNFESTKYFFSDLEEGPSQMAQQLMALKLEKPPTPGQPA